ncbi:MAG: hypothetical protein IT371_17510 [Deltaproteobacteria bacterium]|nr:hypothetical protein [Deltaproteobacteria bacterium]
MRPRRGRPLLRVLALLAGGVALPTFAWLCNTALGVVELGGIGTVALFATVASALAHLFFAPRRPHPDGPGSVDQLPGPTWARITLLLGALFSLLFWGYLALLFVPLIPLSLLAIIWLGLGLAGLAPYGAFAVALVHVLRDLRGLRERLRRPTRVLLVVVPLVLPVAAAALSALHASAARLGLDRTVTALVALPPHSTERLQAVAELRVAPALLVDAYFRAEGVPDRQAAIADAYLRLTDETLHEPVRQRARHRREALVRPWWFLDLGSPSSGPFGRGALPFPLGGLR